MKSEAKIGDPSIGSMIVCYISRRFKAEGFLTRVCIGKMVGNMQLGEVVVRERANITSAYEVVRMQA